MRLVWPCRDGYVSLLVLFGASLGPFSRRLFEWMEEEGACTAADRDKDWINLGMQLWSGEEPRLGVGAAPRPRGRLRATKTKAELMTASLERKVLFAPVTTPAELANLEQLAVRGYWDEVDDRRGHVPLPRPVLPLRCVVAAPCRAASTPR